MIVEEAFGEQLSVAVPLTVQMIAGLSRKTTTRGRDLSVGDYLLFALVRTNSAKDAKMYELEMITLTTPEIEKYAQTHNVVSDPNTPIPVLELKK